MQWSKVQPTTSVPFSPQATSPPCVFGAYLCRSRLKASVLVLVLKEDGFAMIFDDRKLWNLDSLMVFNSGSLWKIEKDRKGSEGFSLSR
ncbi:hypothetical protein GE21DRAFT_1286442 [Neurospora crassa]|nr:hypothetical protein GE21DRAFT_1286442 [Neurospora crassa]